MADTYHLEPEPGGGRRRRTKEMIGEGGLTPETVRRDNEEVEIDLMELFNHLMDHWPLLMAAAALGTIIMAVYTFFVVTPMYEATSKLYVVNSKDSVVNLSDLQIGNYLAQDYVEVFSNWHVHERVLQELNLPYSYREIGSMIQVRNPQNTRILYITCRNKDPELARAIATAYAKVACEFIAVKMEQEQPNIFEEARTPVAPTSPHKTRNLFLGMIVGLLAAAAWLTVSFVMDDKIRTPEDIEKLLNLPTFGVITEQGSYLHSKESRKNRWFRRLK